MLRFLPLLTLSLLLAAGVALAARPNIVFIMADDLGAENLACYGNTVYSTPRLDRMAAEGARFENAYATPACTPTRAMILTGLYPNRSGFLERPDSPLDPDGTTDCRSTSRHWDTYFNPPVTRRRSRAND
jgi:arylsulfatase A